jgi:3-oxoacyl-[acyl-carrier protein] reductase
MPRTKRVALVTGAAQGLGAAIAVRLATDGYDVALVDVNDCTQTLDEIREAGRCGWEIRVDLSDRAKIREHIGGFVNRFPVEVLVNNAGIISTASVASIDDVEWDRVIEINLTAPLIVTQLVWAGMVSRGEGRIVYIGSRAARTGGNNAGPAYVSSKGGLQALAISIAREGAPLGIRANAIMPGPVATEMTKLPSYAEASRATPLGRMGSPSDIAAAVSYLVSDDAQFVTGTLLNVSGGLLMGA